MEKKRLYIIEIMFEGVWKPIVLCTSFNLRTLAIKLPTLTSIPTCRTKRVFSLDAACQIIRDHQPYMNHIDSLCPQLIEWDE